MLRGGPLGIDCFWKANWYGTSSNRPKSSRKQTDVIREKIALRTLPRCLSARKVTVTPSVSVDGFSAHRPNNKRPATFQNTPPERTGWAQKPAAMGRRSSQEKRRPQGHGARFCAICACACNPPLYPRAPKPPRRRVAKSLSIAERKRSDGPLSWKIVPINF